MKKAILITTIFVIASLAVVCFVIYPLFRAMKKHSEDLLATKNTIFSLEAQIENLEQFRKLYRTLDQDLKRTESSFINPDTPIDFIQFLERAGKDAAVSLEISPLASGPQKNDLWPSIGFKLALTGQPPNCLRFLEKLENSPYLTEIQTFSVREISEEELASGQKLAIRAGDATSEISIKAFYQKQP